MKIKVYAGPCDNRKEYMVDKSTKLNDFMTQVSNDTGVNWERGLTMLNSERITAADRDKTFADYATGDVAFLTNSPKQDGGCC